MPAPDAPKFIPLLLGRLLIPPPNTAFPELTRALRLILGPRPPPPSRELPCLPWLLPSPLYPTEGWYPLGTVVLSSLFKTAALSSIFLLIRSLKSGYLAFGPWESPLAPLVPTPKPESSSCCFYSSLSFSSFLVRSRRGLISRFSFSLMRLSKSMDFMVKERTVLPTYTAIVWSSSNCRLFLSRTIVPNFEQLSSM